ncbi:GntR family transcriptional regulator [Bacillus marinisedimentorum]|uniref:GntR family transcriptional regulator n=1 Tax=Bacillus marinisedimentorum TaxID=1821260 RepID=UPI000871FE94|nr:GntR family transcriptional regulator [Bacillus marinisedimentorum]
MFELDVRSRKPIYEQLVDKVKELIIHQVLKPDEKLPSVRALSGELTINPNTIQKAYRELERQGYIYSVKGRGNFVSPMEIMPNQEKLEELKTEIAKLVDEAVYLGLKREDLLELYHEASLKGTEGGLTGD